MNATVLVLDLYSESKLIAISDHAEAQEKDGIAVPYREITLQVARRVALLYEVPALGAILT